MGGSGCGKSTLLKHIIGIEQPARGRVWINGVDTSLLDDIELRDLHMGIGMLFQSSALFGSMTIGENIALPLTEFTSLSAPDIESVVKMKLGMVELAGYDNHFPAELSGGMKKRAGIARAMALEPAMLFLDEPSAGLDPVMVIVTHELETIFNIAHRIIMLDKGAKGIIAEGDPRKLKVESDDRRVTDFFNRRVSDKMNEGTKL
jgi:phospholipid/cholesterol/gamma-HCH transport system ATP-binding protein